MDKSKGKGKARHPLPLLDFPIASILLMWGNLGPPTDAPIVKTYQMTFFPYLLILMMTPAPTPLQRPIPQLHSFS